MTVNRGCRHRFFFACHTSKARRTGHLPLLVAESTGVVTATGSMRVLPHHSMSDCPPLDIVVVPGGWGFRHHMKNRALHQWLRARAAQAETVTDVCTGSLLLSSAGLLDGLRQRLIGAFSIRCANLSQR